MFKTISAAAIALSLIAVPAFAQGGNSAATAPAGAVTTPTKPIVHKARKHVAKYKAHKNVVHQHAVKKHMAHKHAVKKHIVKKHATLTTAKLKTTTGFKSAKPKTAL
ncbi:MAG: hypothetical protein WC670_09385 [Pseudolabrys sp.]|jgi:hypothetical protein